MEGISQISVLKADTRNIQFIKELFYLRFVCVMIISNTAAPETNISIVKRIMLRFRGVGSEKG